MLALIGELKVAARENKHPLAKFLCLLLVRALGAPDAKRFTYPESPERNAKAVLLDENRSHEDIDYALHGVRSHTDYYLERCSGFTIWERASIFTCDILIMYYNKKILHTTIVKGLFSVMTAKAKVGNREAKHNIASRMLKNEKR